MPNSGKKSKCLGTALVLESAYLGVCVDHIVKASVNYEDPTELGSSIVILLFHLPVIGFLCAGIQYRQIGCYLSYIVIRTTINLFLLLFGSCAVVWFEHHGTDHWIFRRLLPLVCQCLVLGVVSQILVIRSKNAFWQGSPMSDFNSSNVDRNMTLGEISTTKRQNRYRRSTNFTHISAASALTAPCKSLPDGLDCNV